MSEDELFASDEELEERESFELSLDPALSLALSLASLPPSTPEDLRA